MLNMANFIKNAAQAGLLSIVLLLVGFAPSAFAQSSDMGPALTKIRDRGYIYVAHRPSTAPFSYVTGEKGGEVVGYSWDICAKVIKSIEEVVGKPLIVVPVPASANNRLMLVKTGMADMECGATTNLTSRQKLVSFSNTFFVAEAKVLVKASGSVKTLADLANKRVAAVLGSTGIRLIRQAAFMRGFTVEIIESRNGKVAFEKLAKGEVDAYVGDDAQIELLRTAATQPGDFSFLPEGLSVEPYAIVLPLENDDLRLLVNKTLTAMMSSGELEQLYAKWFMGPVPPTGAVMNMPMSPLMKSVIQFPNDRPATY